ncbi:MAG: hypothetical protein ACLSHC_14185 [Bilophila wadsworthia]
MERDFPVARVDVYLAVEGVGDELPELCFLACGCWTPLQRGRPGMSCSATTVGRGNQLYSV